MTIQVIQGDCLAILPTLPPESIDLIVTDPPYGQTSLLWDRRVLGWAAASRHVLKPTGSMWVFGTLRFFMESAFEFVGWKLSQDVIWEKHNGTGLFNDRFRRVHETAAHFYRDDAKWASVFKAPQFTMDATPRTVRKKARPAHWIGATGETIYRSEDGGPKLMRSVMFERSDHGRAEHPTQKPLSVLQPLIAYGCPTGGLILDPFAGSGGVGVIARRLGMSATLIEANPQYVALAQRRVADDALLVGDEGIPPAVLTLADL